MRGCRSNRHLDEGQTCSGVLERSRNFQCFGYVVGGIRIHMSLYVAMFAETRDFYQRYFTFSSTFDDELLFIELMSLL